MMCGVFTGEELPLSPEAFAHLFFTLLLLLLLLLLSPMCLLLPQLYENERERERNEKMMCRRQKVFDSRLDFTLRCSGEQPSCTLRRWLWC
jgi:hypothetical protein